MSQGEGRELVHFSESEGVFKCAAALFDSERPRIKMIVPAAIVEHVGATSVPGMLTKGDLDIVVRVSAEQFANAEAALAASYPRNAGNWHSDTFASFSVDDSTPPLGIQLCAIDGPEDTFVRLRDLLRSRPSLVERLNTLKRAWHGRPMDEYRAAKGRFIDDVLAGKVD